MENFDGSELVWTSRTVQHIRRHGGSVRICREVIATSPKFFLQTGRRASHLMIGPDASGRLWTIALDKLNEYQVMPVTAWPSKRSEINRYEEAD